MKKILFELVMLILLMALGLGVAYAYLQVCDDHPIAYSVLAVVLVQIGLLGLDKLAAFIRRKIKY